MQLKEVKQIAEEIIEYTKKSEWKEDTEGLKKVSRVLDRLPSFEATIESLRETQIGIAVSKLKSHTDTYISGVATALLKKWKKDVGILKPKKEKVKNEDAKMIEDTSKPGDLNAAKSRLKEAYQRERSKKDSRTLKVISDPIQKSRRTSLTRPSTVSRKIGKKLIVAPMYMNLSSQNGDIRKFSTINGNIKANTPMVQDRRKPTLPERKPNVIMKTTRPSLPVRTFGEIRKNISLLTDNKSRKREFTGSKVYPNDKVYPDEPIKSKPTTIRQRKSTSTEIYQWLKNLIIDMSEYTSIFIEKGCDSLVLLKQLEFDDVNTMVPKLAHSRLIWNALKQMKDTTPKEKQNRNKKTDHPREKKEADRTKAIRKKRARSLDDDADVETYSDEEFIESDGSFSYRPGLITSMMLGKKRHRYADSDADSSDMEARYDEIREEEARSAYIGKLEDMNEELMEEKRSKLKKRRKLGY